MNISQKGLYLTKSFEGFEPKAYPDQGGVWTIGYGHTGPEVVAGLVWSQQQAEDALLVDMAKAVEAVNAFVAHPAISQNQFDALADFTYNIGVEAFARSTLLRLLNQGEIFNAAAQFHRWDHVGGKESAGLLRRRLAERDLFLEPEAA